MGSRGLHRQLLLKARMRQRASRATGFTASRHTVRNLYRVIVNHASVQKDTPFIVIRDYNTLAIPFRSAWLGSKRAKTARSQQELLARMSEVETEWAKSLDADIYDGLGADTLIINTSDGVLRPKVKRIWTPRWKKARRRLRCGANVESVLSMSRSKSAYEPAYLSDPDTISLTATGEADQLIELLLEAGRARRAGEATVVETDPTLDELVDVIASSPPSNIATQTGDGDDLIRNASAKRYWTISLNWRGKLEALDLDEGEEGAIGGAENDVGATRTPQRRSGRSKGSIPSKRTEMNPARPRHLLFYHPGLDLVFGTTNEDVRMKMALASGQDYSGSGISGYTWKTALSGIAPEIAECDWTSPAAKTTIQSALNRLASRKKADQVWRKTAPGGSLGRINPVELNDELMDRLRTGLITFRGRDLSAIQMVDSSNLGVRSSTKIDFSTWSPPHVRHPRPQSKAEEIAVRASGQQRFRQRPGIDYVVPENPLAPQELATSPVNHRLSHPNRIAPPGPPTRAAAGSFPAPKQIVKQVCLNPGPSLRAAMMRHPPGPPETVYEAPRGDGDEDSDGEDGDFGDGFDWRALKAAKAASPQLSGTWATATSPLQPHRTALRQIVFTNQKITSAVPEGVRTIPVASEIADPDGDGIEEQRRPHLARPVSTGQNRSGSERARARQTYLFKKGVNGMAGSSPLPTTAPKATRSSPGQPAFPPSPATPHYVVSSLNPLVDVVHYCVQSGLPFMRAGWNRVIEEWLAGGEEGIAKLADLALDQKKLSKFLGRLSALVREGGERGLKNQEGPAFEFLQEIAEATCNDGHIPPARLNMTLWSDIFAPMQQNIEQVGRSRLLSDLRSSGRHLGGDFPRNASDVVKHLLRKSHSTFDLSGTAKNAFASLDPAARSILDRELADWFGDVLVDAVYNSKRADAGAEEKPAPNETPANDEKPGARQSSRKSAKSAGAASQAAAIGRKSTSAKVPDLPDFAPGSDFEERLDKIIGKAFRKVDRAQRDDYIDAVRTDVSECANYVLADRDRMIQLRIISIRRNRAKGEKDDSDANGRSLRYIMKARDGEEISKALFVLSAHTRRMQGMDTTDLLPTFCPATTTASLEQLLLTLAEPAHKSQPRRLDWVVHDAGEIATAQLEALLPLLNPTTKSILLEPLTRMFIPTDGTSWSDILSAPSSYTRVELKLRDRFSFELERMHDWLRFALDKEKGSLCNLLMNESLSAEVTHLFCDEAASPKGFIGTGFFQFSSSSFRHTCVDITRVEKAKRIGNEGKPAGVFFLEQCQQRNFHFSELSNRSSSSHRSTPVYCLRRIAGQDKMVRIVPLAAKGAEEMSQLANDVVYGPMPPTMDAGLHGRTTQRRQERQALERWLRHEHPVALAAEIRLAAPRLKTKNGLNVQWGDLEDARARDEAKAWIGDTPPEKLVLLSIDKGEVYTNATFVSCPTDTAGYEGFAESLLYYKSSSLHATERENNRQGSSFDNQVGAELNSPIAESAATGPTAMDAHATMKSLNPENDWRQRQAKVERKAELTRAADQILDAATGGRNERRTPAELAEMKFVCGVGKEGGSTRKGSRGPNAANALVRELEVRAHARGLNILFLLAPETLTSQKCTKPWCQDDEGHRSNVEYARREDGSPIYRLVRCLKCRLPCHRDAVGAINILAQMISLLWHDVPLWRSRVAEEQL